MKKYISGICIFCLLITLYFAAVATMKAGVLSDEYNISENINLLTNTNFGLILFLPATFIIIHIVILLLESIKEKLFNVIALISIAAIVFSAVLTFKISHEVNNFKPNELVLEELTELNRR